MNFNCKGVHRSVLCALCLLVCVLCTLVMWCCARVWCSSWQGTKIDIQKNWHWKNTDSEIWGAIFSHTNSGVDAFLIFLIRLWTILCQYDDDHDSYLEFFFNLLRVEHGTCQRLFSNMSMDFIVKWYTSTYLFFYSIFFISRWKILIERIWIFTISFFNSFDISPECQILTLRLFLLQMVRILII